MYNDSFTPLDDIQCEDLIDIEFDERDDALRDLANEEGGLTADAFALLADMDERGEFSS